MASLKYLNMLGIRPNVEPAPQPQFALNNEIMESLYYHGGNTGCLDTAKISAPSIEEAVIQILNKYNVYIPAVHEVSVGYSNQNNSKTFTLDEVIKVIESVEPRLNVNTVGIWENKTEPLIDKDKLIEKFKSW